MLANGPEFAGGINLRTCALGQAQSSGDIQNPNPGAAWGLSNIKRSSGGAIKIVRLQDVVREPVWLLKLDTEGSEMGVLEGWDSRTHVAPIQHLLIEVKTFNQLVVRDFMARRGYSCRVFVEHYSLSLDQVLAKIPSTPSLSGVALAEALSRPCAQGQLDEEHWFYKTGAFGAHDPHPTVIFGNEP